MRSETCSDCDGVCGNGEMEKSGGKRVRKGENEKEEKKES